MQDVINILAISGSLRPNSANAGVIKCAAEHAGVGVNVTLYDGIGRLPHFDDNKQPGPEVLEWRSQLAAADGILICSPEYAFGVPGSLKNALDWTVSSGELVYKPLALITAATGGDKAHAALLHTFTALSCALAADAQLLIPFVRAKMNPSNEVADGATVKAIETVMKALAREVRDRLLNG